MMRAICGQAKTASTSDTVTAFRAGSTDMKTIAPRTVGIEKNTSPMRETIVSSQPP